MGKGEKVELALNLDRVGGHLTCFHRSRTEGLEADSEIEGPHSVLSKPRQCKILFTLAQLALTRTVLGKLRCATAFLIGRLISEELKCINTGYMVGLWPGEGHILVFLIPIPMLFSCFVLPALIFISFSATL